MSELGIQSLSLGLEGFLSISSGSGSSSIGFFDLGIKFTGSLGILLGLQLSLLHEGFVGLASLFLFNDQRSSVFGVFELLLVAGLLQSIFGLFNEVFGLSDFNVNFLFLNFSISFSLFSVIEGLLSGNFLGFSVGLGLLDLHCFLDELLSQFGGY